MKTFIAAAICFLIVVVLLIVYVNFIQVMSDDFTRALEDIEKKVLDGDWDEAENLLSSFEEEWKKKSKILEIFMDQTETEKVNEHISVSKSYIKSKEQTEALARISSIKEMLRQISQNEKANMRNILKRGSKKTEFNII